MKTMDYCPLIRDECRWEECVLVYDHDEEICAYQRAMYSAMGTKIGFDLIVGKLEMIREEIEDLSKGIGHLRAAVRER